VRVVLGGARPRALPTPVVPFEHRGQDDHIAHEGQEHAERQQLAEGGEPTM